MLGGLRNPKYHWDFFDAPVGTPLQRDGAVAINDIIAEVLRFGATGDPGADPLSPPPPPPAYHTAYDRTAPQPGDDPWDLGPPDGSINVSDIMFAVVQFGHHCL